VAKETGRWAEQSRLEGSIAHAAVRVPPAGCPPGGSPLRDSRCFPSNMTCRDVSHGGAAKLHVFECPIDDDETVHTSDERSRAGDMVRLILVRLCISRTVSGDAHR